MYNAGFIPNIMYSGLCNRILHLCTSFIGDRERKIQLLLIFITFGSFSIKKYLQVIMLSTTRDYKILSLVSCLRYPILDRTGESTLADYKVQTRIWNDVMFSRFRKCLWFIYLDIVNFTIVLNGVKVGIQNLTCPQRLLCPSVRNTSQLAGNLSLLWGTCL